MPPLECPLVDLNLITCWKGSTTSVLSTHYSLIVWKHWMILRRVWMSGQQLLHIRVSELKIDRFTISIGNVTTFNDFTYVHIHSDSVSYIYLGAAVIFISSAEMNNNDKFTELQLLPCSCLWWSEQDVALYTWQVCWEWPEQPCWWPSPPPCW